MAFDFQQVLDQEIDRLLALPPEEVLRYTGRGPFELGPQASGPAEAVGVLLGPDGDFERLVRMVRQGNHFFPATTEFLPHEPEWRRCEVVGWFDGGVEYEDYGAAAEHLGITLPEDLCDLEDDDERRIRTVLATWTIENLGVHAFQRVDGGRFDLLEGPTDEE